MKRYYSKIINGYFYTIEVRSRKELFIDTHYSIFPFLRRIPVLRFISKVDQRYDGRWNCTDVKRRANETPEEFAGRARVTGESLVKRLIDRDNESVKIRKAIREDKNQIFGYLEKL